MGKITGCRWTHWKETAPRPPEAFPRHSCGLHQLPGPRPARFSRSPFSHSESYRIASGTDWDRGRMRDGDARLLAALLPALQGCPFVNPRYPQPSPTQEHGREGFSISATRGSQTSEDSGVRTSQGNFQRKDLSNRTGDGGYALLRLSAPTLTKTHRASVTDSS